MASNLDFMNDINYFLNKIEHCVRVPPSYMMENPVLVTNMASPAQNGLCNFEVVCHTAGVAYEKICSQPVRLPEPIANIEELFQNPTLNDAEIGEMWIHYCKAQATNKHNRDYARAMKVVKSNVR